MARKVDMYSMVSRLGISRRAYALKSRRKRFLVLLFVCLTLFLSGSSLLAYVQISSTYHHYFALAQTGTLHLRNGVKLLESLQEHPFESQTIEHARQEFADALSETQAIKQAIANYAGIAGVVPILGPKLEAAIHLSALAVNLSQAGMNGCDLLGILLPHFRNPLNAKGPTLTMADFKVISGDVQVISTALSGAMDEAMHLEPGDVTFDAHLSTILAGFQAKLPIFRMALADVNQLLPSLPAMLGIGSTPAHYLIEVLDSTELRPAGGFIGNYGIATFTGGSLTSARITDVDLLDRPAGVIVPHISYPPAYAWFANYLAPYSWSMRDSDLDADFPTSAKYGELNYQREGGNVAVQGVIAITPVLMQQALGITGPINVPEYHETVTAQNLVSLIHFHQLGGIAAGQGSDRIASPDGHSSLRKRFTELLAEHFLARVKQLPPDSVARFLPLLNSLLHTKDVQIYFNASSAENVLHLLHLDNTIQSPSGDHLVIVDANVGGNKANSFIVNSVHDQVTIDEQGNAVHRTTISYAWTLAGRNYGSPVYTDYVRVYAPPGSMLNEQDGWQSHGTSTAFGSQVWAGSFTLVYGQTRALTLEWTSYGLAKKEASGWHYQYLLQRQAGIQRTLDLQVALPLCAAMTSRSGGLVAGKNHIALLSQAWTEDVNVGLTYTC
jgi:Protein of unknown function (DUF4012)